jgi:pyruvate, water dikinase
MQCDLERIPRHMRDTSDSRKETKNSHWQWRERAVERLAAELDPIRFGVKAMYLFGSTKNATAGPESDIDILIHFSGNEDQRKDLLLWLEGWSLCLSHFNFEKTGCKTGGLLDAHLVTDKDIQNRTSYAVKIGAVTDAAYPLKLKVSSDTQPPPSVTSDSEI